MFSLIWRFDGRGGHATLAWRIRVDEDAEGRTVLTTRFGGRGSDAESRRRVLASWMLVEELARSHARRLARTIEDYAEEARATELTRLRVVV